MRVPFPIRVLLSYLLVLIVGFLPTYIYLEVVFQERVSSYEVKQLVQRTRLYVARLSSLSSAQRVIELQQMAALGRERLTYIAPDGRVLFDSSVGVGKLDNHGKRPEILLAEGKKARRLAFDPKFAGIGVGRRVSRTTHRDTLYVAMVVSQQSGGRSALLRLSVPLSRVEGLKQTLLQVFRNSLAAAISVALVLSLLSAVVFMRPLQKTAQAAQALVEGDYSVSLPKLSLDEIGDVGRALNALSAELRHRLAMAEASEILLFQLVEHDRTPLAIFDEEGQIRALNGAARFLLETARADTKEVLGAWQGSRAYRRAWELASETQEPQDVVIEIEEGGRKAKGMFYLIQHPSGASFGVFMGLPGPRERFSFLPPSVDVNPVAVAHVIDQCIQRAAPLMERCGVTVTRPMEIGSWMVADVQERLSLSLSLLLEGATTTTPDGMTIPLLIEEQALSVSVICEARIPHHAIATVGLLLEPIGGKIQVEAGKCLLKWPKA